MKTNEAIIKVYEQQLEKLKGHVADDYKAGARGVMPVSDEYKEGYKFAMWWVHHQINKFQITVSDARGALKEDPTK